MPAPDDADLGGRIEVRRDTAHGFGRPVAAHGTVKQVDEGLAAESGFLREAAVGYSA